MLTANRAYLLGISPRPPRPQAVEFTLGESRKELDCLEAEQITRVQIIGADPLAEAGLAALLRGFPTIHLLPDRDKRQPLALNEGADVLLWDLGWEDDQALESIAARSRLEAPVVVLLRDEQDAAQAWKAGARGLLLRDSAAGRLAAALQAVAGGLICLDPRLAGRLFSPALDEDSPFPDVDLTARELEVLQLLAEGLPNKGIALRLEISEHTVKFHVNAILGKLGAQSRTEAAMRAARLGLILI